MLKAMITNLDVNFDNIQCFKEYLEGCTKMFQDNWAISVLKCPSEYVEIRRDSCLHATVSLQCYNN